MTEFLVKTALAAEGLVPCGPGKGVDCTTEDQLLELVVRVINFMIHNLAFPLVVLFFLLGGFLMLTSGGSPNRIDQGKKAITGAVIGLVIVLTSVVLINTFLKVFTNCDVDFKQVGTINAENCFKKD